jgi:RES domain-containing protein
MPRGWRIVKTTRVSSAFDGVGASRFGGRWNSPRTAVVYTSENLALAALEIVVHLQSSAVLGSYSSIAVDFDDRLVEVIAPGDLPSDWARYPAPTALQQIGDQWAASKRSAVLRVPSVIVPSEANYILNPSHADFSKIRVGSASAVAFDRRLFTRQKD